MEFRIEGNPDYGDLTVRLAPTEKLIVDSGSMTRMSGNLDVKSRCLGGLFRAILRKFLGGESLFVGEYSAPSGGSISLAPCYPGTIMHRKMTGESFFLTAGSFLACSDGIDVNTVFGGFKAFLSGEGAFLLEIKGSGDLYYAAYGGVVEREINGEITVDTGHVVGWEPSLDYKIGGMGGLKSTFFSGEGLVMKFSGRGKLYLQTRNLGGLVSWLSPFCVG